MAHITMLESIGLLGKDELPVLLEELRRIHADIEAGRFIIEEGVEDVHSQVELLLTRKLGDMGKKIHSGRSRNDQVLVDLKLFTRAQLQDIAEEVRVLFEELQAQSERYKGCSCRAIPTFRWPCLPVSDYGSGPTRKVWWTTCFSFRPPTR